MKLKIREKEYNIFFSFEPTLKARILSKMAKMSVELGSSSGDFEKIEDMLLFIPEVILVGLQKYHSEEFGYDLDTKDGFDEKKEKVFSLVSEYFDSGEVDCMEFFNQLQEEMTKNGFLKKTFEREVEQAKKEMETAEAEKKKDQESKA